MRYINIILALFISFLAIETNAKVHVRPNQKLYKNLKIKLAQGWTIDSSKYGYLFLKDTIEDSRVKIYTEENADQLNAKTIFSSYYRHYLSDSINKIEKDSIINGASHNGYWVLLESKNFFGEPMNIELCVINFQSRSFFIETVYTSNSTLLIDVLTNTTFIGQTNSHLKQRQKYFFFDRLSDGLKQDTIPEKILLTRELLQFLVSKESYRTSSELRSRGNDVVRFSENYERKIDDLRIYGYEKGYSIISFDMTEFTSNDSSSFPEYYGNIVLQNPEGNTLIINYSAIIIQQGLFLKGINIGTVSFGG